MQRTNAMVKEVCITDILNDDVEKGAWIELDEDSVHEMFTPVEAKTEQELEVECLDNRFNYTIYGADWYEEKFPGFSDLTYEILAREHEALNANPDPVTENPAEYQ